ncbi:MAG: hypothetical protein L6R38_004955 [Xanthoria sp. 2 TBL-2021]|nr:MAG: hypothetical protein L6R38_004955 [Xanthoria sp. 2 TBL-2021]
MPIKSKSKPTTSLSKKKDASPPPKWPPLKPLVPTSDLVRETLLENQIVVIRNFFTSSLCKTYVSFLSSLPLVTTPGQPKRGDAVRVNDRFQVDDPSFAESLWKSAGLEDLVTRSDEDNGISQQTLSQLWGGEVCGLNPKIRIYRYSKGQFFSQHYDESNILSLPNSPAKTTWTLLIYLTGPSTGCIGGETIFYPELGPAKSFSGRDNDGNSPIVMELEVGMALLHRHGQDCLLHEGKEVTAGEKWVIRSDLCVKR